MTADGGWISLAHWSASVHDEPIREDAPLIIGFDPADPGVAVLCQVTDDGRLIIWGISS